MVRFFKELDTNEWKIYLVIIALMKLPINNVIKYNEIYEVSTIHFRGKVRLFEM